MNSIEKPFSAEQRQDCLAPRSACNLTQRTAAKTKVGLMVTLVLFFSIGRYIPGFEWTLDVVALTTLISALWVCQKPIPLAIKPIRNYIWLIVLLVPLWGAVMAQVVFGQPAWLGLASQRGFLLVPFVLVLISRMQQGLMHLRDIENALTNLAWINLAICAPVLIFLDPNNYTNNDIGSLVTNGGGVYNRFVLPMPFIIFGAFYYFARGITFKSRQSVLMCFPFLFYIFGGNSGRVLNLAMLTSFLVIALLARREVGRSLRNIMILAAISFLVVLVASWVLPEHMATLVEKYTDAFSVLAGADSVDDWSANARILQFGIVMPWVDQYFLFGTGTISNQWNDGYKGLFGYLHPSDLGFLGIIFQYGVVGLAFFVWQYLLAWRSIVAFVKHTHDAFINPFLLGCCGCMCTLLFTSVTTGSIAFNAEQTIFYILLIQAGVYIRKDING